MDKILVKQYLIGHAPITKNMQAEQATLDSINVFIQLLTEPNHI